LSTAPQAFFQRETALRAAPPCHYNRRGFADAAELGDAFAASPAEGARGGAALPRRPGVLTNALGRMDRTKKNVATLAVCQALLFTNNSTAIAINGLAGYALASNKALATLPVTGWVVGAAIATFPASLLMKRIGRRNGFTVGALVGILGASICSLAVYLADFWLLCLGTLVFGVYNGAAQYYRFAAADAAPPHSRSKAISLVLAGGLVGGLVGPEASKLTVDLLATRYLGAYLSLMGFLVLVILTLRALDIPPPGGEEQHGPSRPLRAIVTQPAFVVAAVGAALGYGTMNLLMTATPLAMGVCGHPYAAAAFVIQWHVVAMFAPSFVTGGLIKRFGVLNVMLAGAALLLVCVAVALSGITVAHFWFALVLLGIGWNFLYIGGTALATETYRPAEKAKAQGANDLVIFLVMASSSFSSGMLLERNGWELLNYLAAGFVVLIVAGVVSLQIHRRRLAANAA
jgi:MFS family permease